MEREVEMTITGEVIIRIEFDLEKNKMSFVTIDQNGVVYKNYLLKDALQNAETLLNSMILSIKDKIREEKWK